MKYPTTKTTIVFEHEGSTDQLHQALCEAINEGDKSALSWLAGNVCDIIHPDVQSDQDDD